MVLILTHCVHHDILAGLFPNMSEKQRSFPSEIIAGLIIDYKCDCTQVVGIYVDASIDDIITNDNMERQNSCVYLGPSGKRQGSINYL